MAKGKVLVTGGAGYIGSHTVVELIQSGYEAVIIDNLCNACEESVARVEKITGTKIKFVNADVRDKSALDKIFEEDKIDWVIHFAGLKAVGESCVKPIEYYDNNLNGTLVLLQSMREHGCKKIVFSSSATVYGDPEVLPLTEDCKTGGTTNPYGTSKYFQEIMLNDVYKADNEWTIVLLRYFNPVGAHESGLIGEDPKGIPNNLTPYIAKVAVGQLKEVGVFGNDYPTPDGTGVRDYIHVVDLAKGHVSAISHVKNKGVYTYNLGTGVGYSVLDVIHAFEKACGHKLPYVIKPRRSGDIAACYADASKAKRELEWEAKLGIDEMCASLWNWQTHNPNGYKS
jgi:UDP-glucose 4-epimerase